MAKITYTYMGGGRQIGKTEKMRHVMRARQTRRHSCHWPGCTEQVPPAMWGCKRHWFTLPKTLRDKVWAMYRPGQEEQMNPSNENLEVAYEVQKWIADGFDKWAAGR